MKDTLAGSFILFTIKADEGTELVLEIWEPNGSVLTFLFLSIVFLLELDENHPVVSEISGNYSLKAPSIPFVRSV